MTAAELERRCGDGGRFELIQGRLQPRPMAGGALGSALSRLLFAVGEHVYGNNLGAVFAAGTGFLTARSPDTVLCASLAFVSSTRLTSLLPEGFVPLPPDFVAERCLPDETPDDVRQKVSCWLEAGVRLVWAIDPVRGEVTAYRTGNSPQVLTLSDTLSGVDVLPGLTVPVKLVFCYEPDFVIDA